jgi:hypothetical protein
VIVTAVPATVIVVVRGLLDVFSATESITEPLPEDAAGLIPTHDALLDAVQAQPAGEVTVTPAEPASAVIDTAVGETAKVHGALPAWSTTTNWPATRMFPVRSVEPVFAVTDTVIVPVPVPDAGLTDFAGLILYDVVIHGTSAAAAQLQPLGAVIVNVALPASGAIESKPGAAV